MVQDPADVELREQPKRPFGVYVLVFVLALGVFTAALEIIRVRSQLTGIWADTDEFLRDRSGLVSLVSAVFTGRDAVTIVHSVLIVAWLWLIVGLWLLQRWAWLLLMIVTGVTLTYALFRYFAGNPDYVSMLTNVAVAFYLNDNSVQRAFARRTAEEPA